MWSLSDRGLYWVRTIDVVDVGVDAVGQREVDDPVLATERDGGLGALLRQDREALAFPARKDDRHGPLHGPDPPPDVDWFRVAMLARGVLAKGFCPVKAA